MLFPGCRDLQMLRPLPLCRKGSGRECCFAIPLPAHLGKGPRNDGRFAWSEEVAGGSDRHSLALRKPGAHTNPGCCCSDPLYVTVCCRVALFLRRADCCLLYTSPSPRDGLLSRMPSSA